MRPNNVLSRASVLTGLLEMKRPLLTELPYHKDSARLFEALADRPWAVFLDSGYPYVRQGRFDILSADPMTVVCTRGTMTETRTRHGSHLSPDDPFQCLRRALALYRTPPSELPFCGGAIGYFSYDLGRRLERLPEIAEDAEKLPEMAIGIYDWALVVDHVARQSWLVGQGFDSATRGRWPELITLLRAPQVAVARPAFATTGAVSSNMDRVLYAAAFKRIKHYIRAGDCYQVNLAQRFAAATRGAPWLAYRRLRQINPAPFGAYVNTPHAYILSASPERFLQVRGGSVETRPIKGTRPRSPDRARDRAAAAALQASAKDRAENLMIVDLLRNDIGKCCAPGSVRVPKLFNLESFATVHHLVSTVTGRLAAGRDCLDMLRGCFPGGSITGAPKLRAMEIIEELEPHRRGIYCGSIGYVGFDGAMDTNIAIRTLVMSGGKTRFWAGGGIVADSELKAEYQETFDKAAAMLRLLERGHEAVKDLGR
jgi:para-aminobenzoate synthetase component 1